MTLIQSRKWLFCVLAGALLLGSLPGAPKTSPAPADDEAFVEVHGPDIAFVPLTAEYVKYDGKLRKVARIAAAPAGGKEDCQCPSCCEGHCYVVIYTVALFPMGPIRVLGYLWLDC